MRGEAGPRGGGGGEGLVCFAATARPDAAAPQGLTNKICKAPPPPLPDKYSTEWRELVRSCLRKAPSERPTVAALLASPVLAGPLAKVEASFGPPTTAGATPVVITKHDAAAILEVTANPV